MSLSFPCDVMSRGNRAPIPAGVRYEGVNSEQSEGESPKLSKSRRQSDSGS
jgi:hypothetical protein